VTRQALVCAPLMPEFDRESGSQRIFDSILFLREAGFDVTFVAENGHSSDRYRQMLHQLGVATYSGLNKDVNDLIAGRRFDVAIIAFWSLAESLLPRIHRLSPATRVVVDSIDLHFVRNARRTFHDPVEHIDPVGYSGAASISANPNPVPPEIDVGATTIAWTTGDASVGQVFVSINGAAEHMFAQGASGRETINWIHPGAHYEFRLYRSGEPREYLCQVSVCMSTRRGLLSLEYASDLTRELNTYASADAVLTVSQKEADLVNDLVGDPQLAHVVPDNEELTPSNASFEERRGIVFIGNFRHPPNIEAIHYLCGEIVPLLPPALLREHPLYVVGNGLDEQVRRIGEGLPSVRMVGWVPSVLPYLHRTRMSVVPLLYGAGTKRKLIQALMAGTPSVTTSVGAEGLGLEHERHALIVNTPGAFADGIVQLAKGRRLWARLAREGASHVRARHSREFVRFRFLEVIESLLASPRPASKMAQAQLLSAAPATSDPYRQLVRRIRETISATVPPDSTVLVVSRGDTDLVQLEGRRAWHFPCIEGGVYAGCYPPDSDAAILHLEELHARGAEFLVFPSTALWWLEHYTELKHHLQRHYRLVSDGEETCLIYRLSPQGGSSAGPAESGAFPKRLKEPSRDVSAA
jgi:glycosyltransferase involved in cell wall biosynthesis